MTYSVEAVRQLLRKQGLKVLRPKTEPGNPPREDEQRACVQKNVNLIERFWTCVKEHLVKNTSYEKYKTFRAHVFRFLNHVEDYAEE